MKGLPPRNLFTFSKRERRGLYVLLTLLAGVLIFRLYLPALLPPVEPLPDDTVIRQKVEAWLDSARPGGSENLPEVPPVAGASDRVYDAFDFDPNRVGLKDMERLGFTPRQIDNLIKYREKGGRFVKATELTRIYGMDEDTYERLKDYILIPEAPDKTSPDSARAPRELQSPTLPLNGSDTFQFTLLPGIGPVYARRICKYRNLLGGFVATSQLTEVYGLDTLMVQQLDPYLVVDSLLVRKINLNAASFGELVRHPYINAYQVRALLNYRRFRGKISHPMELAKNNILDSITYKKMEPYIEVGD